jgi:hypothetical protein
MIKHSLPPDEEPGRGPPNLPEAIVAIVFIAIVWAAAVIVGAWAFP